MTFGHLLTFYERIIYLLVYFCNDDFFIEGETASIHPASILFLLNHPIP